MYLTNRLSTLSSSPPTLHRPDIVSHTNTSPSTERKNVQIKSYLVQWIGDKELVQIPTRKDMPLRKTGPTKQTETQDEDQTPDLVKARTP